MDNNITTLIKAIKFMNKKTFIPFFDDYVIVENGKIVLQDINKTYILKIDCLSDNDNFVFKKQYILDIQQKNSKYFLKSKNDNSLLISVVSKELESEHEIPIEQKKMNHFAQMKDSLVCFNEIEFNGVNLKKMLKGHKDDITFSFSEEKLFISKKEENFLIDAINKSKDLEETDFYVFYVNYLSKKDSDTRILQLNIYKLGVHIDRLFYTHNLEGEIRIQKNRN